MFIDPWRARHYGEGYSAEYLPIGESNWRILRKNGVVRIFRTAREARQAAKERYFERLEPEVRASLPVDPERVASKLKAEAEQWIKSSRGDMKKKTTICGKNRRQITVIKGRRP